MSTLLSGTNHYLSCFTICVSGWIITLVTLLHKNADRIYPFPKSARNICWDKANGKIRPKLVFCFAATFLLQTVAHVQKPGLRSRIPNNTGSRSRIFCPTPTPDAQLDHFLITLLNWEFLLKWYNFFWNFCWIRDFLLCTTISIDFNSQISSPLC